MRSADREPFADLIGGVYEFYGKDLTGFSLDVWWEAMQAFDMVTVREALSRHCLNPDTGQFLPRPADVVKMLGGTSKDAAIVAWAKVDKAVRLIGSHQTVVFDDPLIHRAVEELGGWIWLGTQTDKEWPFVEKRFCDHYRVYKARSEIPSYPPKLYGITDTQNGARGFPEISPTLIGDPWVCVRVMQGGDEERLRTLQMTSAAALPPAALLEHKE